jgi:large conductance mechanosensitive channel
MLKGFKDFILRGNVIDLAVAVVIGAAFTALVAAITANLIEPVLNALGGVDTGGWGFYVNPDKPDTSSTSAQSSPRSSPS